MQTYGVSCVVGGHNHNHATVVKDGILYITVGSVSKKNYVTLDVTATGVSMEKVNV